MRMIRVLILYDAIQAAENATAAAGPAPFTHNALLRIGGNQLAPMCRTTAQ
jgi:hypothetical protein